MLEELLVVTGYADEYHIGVNPCVGKDASYFFGSLSTKQSVVGTMQIFSHANDVSAAVLATTRLWDSVVSVHWLGIRIAHDVLLCRLFKVLLGILYHAGYSTLTSLAHVRHSFLPL